MDLGLEGRRAIVTGASRGIGLEIARALAAEGCSLAICARGKEALDEAADELSRTGVTVHAQPVDMTQPEAGRDFVSSAAAALGGVDIVVSNASPGSLKGDDAWVESARGDLQALAVLAEAARSWLAASEAAAVVALGSTSGFDSAFPSGPTSFAAIKAAVIQHAAALARAYASDGIRVNSVSPGPILLQGGAWAGVRDSRPEAFEQVTGQIPRGRLGETPPRLRTRSPSSSVPERASALA